MQLIRTVLNWLRSDAHEQQNVNHEPIEVRLYTRAGCHLCEEAHQILRDHNLTVEIVDIAHDTNLEATLGLSIPVVEINGRVRFRGKVDPRLLRRILLHGRQPLES